MRNYLILLLLLTASSNVLSQGDSITRTIDNTHTGAFEITAPADWKPLERTHIQFRTTFYRLESPHNQFGFELMINDKSTLGLAGVSSQDLERYMIESLSAHTERSVEKVIQPVRFGTNSEGVYVTLTDSNRIPGEFLYWTQGIRLTGNNAIKFSLYTNQKKNLKPFLDVVDSVKFLP